MTSVHSILICFLTRSVNCVREMNHPWPFFSLYWRCWITTGKFEFILLWSDLVRTIYSTVHLLVWDLLPAKLKRKIFIFLDKWKTLDKMFVWHLTFNVTFLFFTWSERSEEICFFNVLFVQWAIQGKQIPKSNVMHVFQLERECIWNEKVCKALQLCRGLGDFLDPIS